MVVVFLKSAIFKLYGLYEVTKVGSEYRIKKAWSNNFLDDPTKTTFTREELIGPNRKDEYLVEINGDGREKLMNLGKGWWGGYRKKLNTRRKRRNKSRKTNKYRFFR